MATTRPTPKKYTIELQYTPRAFAEKLETLLESVRQHTGYARLYAEVGDDQLKRFEFGEQYLMSTVQREYWQERNGLNTPA